uniref:ATP-dependent RNA helicase SUPV3L1 n=1 Tax=Rhizophora mucronata TaxID=61149 RepID=A0A2P2KLG6_RHIMU
MKGEIPNLGDMLNNVPAICLISGTVKSLISVPSNFFIVENMILEMFRLRPIPMASLATRTSNSLLASLNIVACLVRVSGGNDP